MFICRLARLLEIAYDTLYNHFKADRLKPSKLAETLTQCGFNLTDYSTKGIPDLAIIFTECRFEVGKSLVN